MTDQAVLLEEIIRTELRPYVQQLVERLTIELVREQLANGNGDRGPSVNGNGNRHTTAQVVLQAAERPPGPDRAGCQGSEQGLPHLRPHSPRRSLRPEPACLPSVP